MIQYRVVVYQVTDGMTEDDGPGAFNRLIPGEPDYSALSAICDAVKKPRVRAKKAAP